MNYLIYILMTWNVIVFLIYGIDKWKSISNKWRIKESTLITSAFLMGGLGAAFGMTIFHHKTKHIKFKILVPLAVVFNLLIVLGIMYIWNINFYIKLTQLYTIIIDKLHRIVLWNNEFPVNKD